MGRWLVLALLVGGCVPSSPIDRGAQPLLSYPSGLGTVSYSDDPSGAFNVNGNVTVGPVTIYPIFYGAHWTLAQEARVIDFLTHLSGSPQFSLMVTYNAPFNAIHIPNTFSVGPSTTRTAYPAGYYIAGTDGVGAIVEDAIANGGLTRDESGVYAVLLDDQVGGYYSFNGNPAYCSGIEADHPIERLVPSSPLQTLLIVNPDLCRGSGRQFDDGLSPVGPNSDVDFNFENPSSPGHPVVDKMVNLLWHELSEALSDPVGGGYGVAGQKADGTQFTKEIADLCEGPEAQDTAATIPIAQVQLDLDYTVANGAPANVHLGTHDYLLQSNWQHVDNGGCVRRLMLSRPAPAIGKSYATGDLDGNGVTDLVFRDAASGQFHFALLDTSGNLMPVSQTLTLQMTTQVYGFADFDKDHQADFLLRDIGTNVITIQIMDGATPGRTIIVADLGMPTSATPVSANPRAEIIKAIGDFDGDGYTDILFQNAETNAAHIAFAPALHPFTSVASLPALSPQPAGSLDEETIGAAAFGGSSSASVLSRNLDSSSGLEIVSWSFGALDRATNTVPVSYSGWSVDMYRVLGLVDLDRDGAVDVIGVRADAGGDSLVWQKFDLRGGATPATATRISAMPDPRYRFSGGGTMGPTIGGAAGKASITWRDRVDGSTVRWLFNGTSRVDTNLTSTVYPPNWDLVAN